MWASRQTVSTVPYLLAVLYSSVRLLTDRPRQRDYWLTSHDLHHDKSTNFTLLSAFVVSQVCGLVSFWADVIRCACARVCVCVCVCARVRVIVYVSYRQWKNYSPQTTKSLYASYGMTLENKWLIAEKLARWLMDGSDYFWNLHNDSSVTWSTRT